MPSGRSDGDQLGVTFLVMDFCLLGQEVVQNPMDILKQLWLAQKEMIGKRRLTKFVLVWDPDLRYCTTRPNKSNKTSVMTT